MPKKKIFSNLERRANEMRERNLAELVTEDEREELAYRIKEGRMKRPRNRCPVCLDVHTLGNVPATCFQVAHVSGISFKLEFEEYIVKNKLGHL